MRIQKYMSQCGIASRRKSEELVLNGRVLVNGELIKTPGYLIDPDVDIVSVDGVFINPESLVYYILNKPIGVVSSSEDKFAEQTVVDLIDVPQRLYTIGRLDKDTEGLILVTNDGEMTEKLTHPRHQFEKTYWALVKGHMDASSIQKLKNGVDIEVEDGIYRTKPAKVNILKEKRGATMIEIIISEGKNRQVRKMCNAVNHPVIQLRRVGLGDLKDPGLKNGEWRKLTEAEVNYLKGVE